MNTDQILYINKATRRLKLYKKLALIISLITVITPPIVFYLITVSETKSFGNALDQHRYDARMHDSLTYALTMFLCLLLVITLLLWMLNYFFNRYITVINNLSGNDIDKFQKTNEAIKFSSYMPPFIISGRSVFFFKAFNIQAFLWNEIKNIKIRKIYIRRSAYMVILDLSEGTYRYLLPNNLRLIQIFTEEALKANPTIKIDLA